MQKNFYVLVKGWWSLKMLKIKGSITNFKKSLKSDNLTLILRNVGN